MKMKTYILSGGMSSRMGEDKGLKPILGKPGIGYLLDMLRTIGIFPVIIARADGYGRFGLRVIEDVISGKGPMGGVFTALSDAGEDVLILAADTPFISAAVVQTLIGKSVKDKICVVRYNDRIQPLCGIYPMACFAEVRSRVESSRLKMMGLLDDFPVHYVDLNGDEAVFHNNNTPADHAMAVHYLRTMKVILPDDRYHT